jgi:hypothetical protein
MEFDFLDTSGRVSTAFDELNLSVENWGTDFENVIKLITTPLTEGIASGEDAPPTGTQITDEGAYETSAPYSGTPAPQVMLEGGISGTTALLPKGAKGADRYVGFTSGFRTSRRPSHNGIDIGTSGERGYYVAFLLDGTATLKPNLGNAGNVVEIKSGGTTYKFFHLARFSIKSGTYKAGTAIGEIGNTGNSRGIHLHYEVWPPGTNGVDPTPYVNLIRIGKNLGKPIAAPASVASSSTSQPQQNLMGTSSSSSSGGGRWKPLLDVIASGEGGYESVNPGQVVSGLTQMTIAEAWNTAQRVGKSKRGSGAMGRYQLLSDPVGRAKKAGLDPYRDKFSPANQDKIAVYILENIRYGKKWLSGNLSGGDASFAQGIADEWAGVPNLSGKYSYSGQGGKVKASSVKAALNQVKSGSPQQAQVASSPSPAQTSSPPPAQIASQSQSQSQISQSLAPERTGPTVIISQNPSSPARQMMYSGGGGSSGGGSSQISEFTLLNNFIKNKLLLDLAYL